MKRIIISTLCALATVGMTFAEIPKDRYNSLVGKSGAELKEAVKQAGAADFERIPYGDKTWEVFELTDERTYGQLRIWFDMYSNQIQSIANGHSGMNIEHSVPNSWWGGKSESVDAYSDIVHLNPSNGDANNRKSANPLGEIAGTPTWTNGITSIGEPTSLTNDGGNIKTVFEPADEYKGDFARAYFYVFTIYNDIPWKAETAYMYDISSPLTLKPWAYQMLLDWATMDPVDSREINRNEQVYLKQGNRNPFIDLPSLAEYIWGDLSTEPFPASEIKDPVAVNRPDSPRPLEPEFNVTAVNGYTSRWWDAMTITLAPFAPGVTGYYTVDGGEPQEFADSENPEIDVEAATEVGEQKIIQVYAEAFENGIKLSSAVTTLTLIAREAGVSDYSHHTWELVTTGSQIDTEKNYIIVSDGTNHVMGATAFKGSSNYITDVGEVLVTDNRITTLPEGVGVVSFEKSGNQYVVEVSDITGKSNGYMYTTAAKSMTLKEEGTPANVSIDAKGNAIMSFGTAGTLQYNAQSPRFCAYTSSQKPLKLFVSLGDLSTGVAAPIYDCGLQKIRVYDLTGRRCDPAALRPGLYIFVRGTEATKQIIR